jgi:uncharacterized membrane protein
VAIHDTGAADRVSPQKLRKPYLLSTAISSAGLILSLYLALLPPPTFCDISSFLSCDLVLSSPYARLGGIPTATLGLGYFAAATALSPLASKSKRASKTLLILSIIAVVGVAALVYTELVLIGAICLLCTAAHLLGIAVFAISLMGFRSYSA